jgi:hypothetical protein
MDDQFSTIAPYPTLTDAQRIQAMQTARRNLVQQYAQKPVRTDFHDWTVSRFPRWFVLGLSVLLLVVVLSAGLISGFRLYYAGHDYFLRSIDNPRMAEIVGYATPLAAELLVILAAMAGRVYLIGRSRWLTLLPMTVGMAVAFVGNWTITQPTTTWGWVETLFPPFAVLSVAFMAEVTFVPELERRRANEHAYRVARDAYDRLVANPETHDKWRSVHALALWDMWRRIYPDHDPDAIAIDYRRDIVLREMAAASWFEDASNFNAIALKAGASKGKPGRSNREIVEEFYRNNPDALQLQQREIAELLGISESAISRYKPSTNGHQEAP